MSGIGIGSSEGQVRAAYPGRIATQAHPYTQGGHYLVFKSLDGSRKLIFVTDGSSVTSFRAGASDEVGYIEGCF